MYIASLVDKQIENNQIRVWVDFTDGETIVRQDFIIENSSHFDQEVRTRINRLNTFAELPLGEVTLTEPEVVAPTAEEIAKAEYEIKLDELIRNTKLVELGIGDESKILTLKSELTQLKKG